ncbi:MAG: AMP-binding protein, partial [Lachnospiraceae bacterium]|nr:AMP-binding protein [Lachnospiraceae bacterium]
MKTNILQYLEEDAERFPNKIALADEAGELTYIEYMQRAQIIGSYLLANVTGGKINQPIAVLIDRNVDTVIAFMGILYSGNFYVPIEPSMPEERIRLILDSLNPMCILDANEGSEAYESTIKVTHILQGDELNQIDLSAIRSRMIDADPLNVIFTSGSTGVPKGVMKCHRSVIDMAEIFGETFGFDHTQVFGNQSPFDFDVSAKDIYNALRNGARLEILPKKLFMSPKLLLEYLCERKIDTLIWAVSALRIVADFKALDKIKVPGVRYIMFSGEAMPVKAINYWIDHVPGAKYVNLYAPTEITFNCTYYEITDKYKEDRRLPIGKPFSNYRVFLKDDQGNIVDDRNHVGEICVGGAGLALGYWNNKEDTERAFVQDPLAAGYGSIVYTTGDLAYYDESDDLVFVSRKDYQIKHMGHRIELG